LAKKAFVYDGTNWIDIAQSTTDLSNYANLTTTPISGFRNILINGDFRIWQRGTSSSHSGGGVYVDMWREYTDVGSATQSRDTTVTVPRVANQSYKFTVGGSATNFNLFQIIESANCGHLAGQTVTFSFYASVSSARNLNVVLASSTTTDALWTGSWTSFSSTAIALTTSMTRYTVTTTVPSNMKTLQVAFGSGGTLLAAGSSVNITGAQLEVGSIATPFEQRPIGTELALCQRYYFKIFPLTAARIATGFNATTTTAIFNVYFPVEMRIAATAIEQSGTASDYAVTHGNFTITNSNSVPAYVQGSRTNASFTVGVASGLTAGQGSMLYANNSNATLAWRAEL
jgi:hypothetical protein